MATTTIVVQPIGLRSITSVSYRVTPLPLQSMTKVLIARSLDREAFYSNDQSALRIGRYPTRCIHVVWALVAVPDTLRHSATYDLFFIHDA